MADNTWPGGAPEALSQSQHEAWNADNSPGTRQMCVACDEPTGRCEETALYVEDGDLGPLCEACYDDYFLQDL